MINATGYHRPFFPTCKIGLKPSSQYYMMFYLKALRKMKKVFITINMDTPPAEEVYGKPPFSSLRVLKSVRIKETDQNSGQLFLKMC